MSPDKSVTYLPDCSLDAWRISSSTFTTDSFTDKPDVSIAIVPCGAVKAGNAPALHSSRKRSAELTFPKADRSIEPTRHSSSSMPQVNSMQCTLAPASVSTVTNRVRKFDVQGVVASNGEDNVPDPFMDCACQ